MVQSHERAALGGVIDVPSRPWRRTKPSLSTLPPARDAARRPLDAAAATQENLDALIDRVASRRRSRYERFLKAVIDVLAASLVTLALLPVLLCTAAAVYVSLGRPVLIRQQRVGRDGRVFAMYKFRTMLADRRRGDDPTYTGPERRLTHKSPNDPRHTRLGRKLRAFGLDEMPQLFNVLLGHMSLIGPRPEMAKVVAHYHGWQQLRHVVKPGITGLWQVTERANGTLLHERTDLDLTYIDRLSLRTDVRILVATPRALLRRDNVH